MRLLAILAAIVATPAFAQEASHDAFVSLRNTDFIVLLAFILFVAILLYYRVPAMVAKMLDGRAEGIRTELAEARALRDEAQALLGSFDARRRDMAAQAERIVTEAREEAERASAQAQDDAARAVARRIASAEEQIAGAQARAIRQVRDQAVGIAVEAAREVLVAQMTAAEGQAMIDASIATVEARMN